MAGEQSLAVEYVEFVAKGLSELNSGVDDLRKRLGTIKPAAVDAGGALGAIPDPAKGGGSGGAALAAVGSLVSRTATAVVGALKTVTTTLAGLAAAGLQQTAVGGLLIFWTGQLARSITAALLPAFNFLLSGIQRLTQFFRSLSESQQNALMGLVTGFAVFRVAAFALGGPLGMVAGILTAIMLGSRSGQGALSQLAGTFNRILEATKPLLDALGNLLSAALARAVPFIEAAASAVTSLLQQITAMIQGAAGGSNHLLAFGLSFLAIGKIIPLVTTSIQALFAAFRIGLAATGIGAIVQLFLAVAMSTESGRAGLSKILGAIMTLVKVLGEALSPVISMVADVVDTLVQVLGVFMNAVGTVTKAVIDFAVDMAKKVDDALGTGDIREAFQDVSEGHEFKGFLKAVGFTILHPYETAKIGLGGPDELRRRLAGRPEQDRGEEKPGRQLEPGRGHFEDLEAQFRRVQEANASGSGKKPEERSADFLQNIWLLMQQFAREGVSFADEPGKWLEKWIRPKPLRPQEGEG